MITTVFTDLLKSGTDPGFAVFSPLSGDIADCAGCLDCWYATPGVCRLRDKGRDICPTLARSSELVVVSSCVYGGCSPFVKNLLDRSIGYLSPYFRIKDRRMAHYTKYRNRLSVRFLFYGDFTPREKATAASFASACAGTFNAGDHSVVFYPEAEAAWAEIDPRLKKLYIGEA